MIKPKKIFKKKVKQENSHIHINNSYITAVP